LRMRDQKKSNRVNQRQLAELTGLDPSVISRKTSAGDLYRHPDGKYDIAASFHALRIPLPDNLGSLSLDDRSQNSAGDYVNFEEWRAKKEKEMALIKAMEREELEGLLVRKADIIKEVQNALSNVKARLLSMPSKLGPVVAHESSAAVTKNLIEDAVIEALSELSGLFGNSEPMLPSPATSSQTKHQPVGGSRKATKSRGVSRTRTVAK
jgi:hypothetical protein